ncbi:MAG: pyrroloquinoline quinone biosynthesis protein PqqE [Candidatus Eremiobacteraeota bacterium]|nr:pyrroloquinoline quinone biosynthesis protein PqqE [Candidatus Eremiobacteraeota bacterium]MBV8374022.1 pyrroloquinoline quinone biosynthesis protein PqqE [Candidatus Eremiobacteraeota bacterium]
MTAPPRPLSILCELTYRCNLQCPYCYNPLNLRHYADELPTTLWQRVLSEAAELGAVQAHFSGGEPTLRQDLCDLVASARACGLYTNLITQGTFLHDAVLDALLRAGLDHVQLSIQAPQAGLADRIAGASVHDRKIEALQRIRNRDVALTINCVLHRLNHDAIEETIALAERLGVARLELANVQFYGWAYRNRSALMPTREQVRRGEAVVAQARRRLRGRMEIIYVLPDYFGEFPKPCMNGWGSTFLTVAPNGDVLPCPAAAAIASLEFENVRHRSLSEIWQSSETFVRYRGTHWMPEPCRSCERREIDWGGCRCQAFLVTGDAGATDPACSLSPNHELLVKLREQDAGSEFVPRHPSAV